MRKNSNVLLKNSRRFMLKMLETNILQNSMKRTSAIKSLNQNLKQKFKNNRKDYEKLALKESHHI